MKKTFTHLALAAILALISLPLWSQNVNPVNVVVNTPDGVIDWRIDGISAASWGTDVNLNGPFTGKLVVARDTNALDSLALYCCDTVLINPDEINGNIALISRGDCEFGLKAYNAQIHGATAVIIGNRAPLGHDFGSHTHGLIWMGGGAFGPQVTIPAIFINYDDHIILRKMIDSGMDVNITIEAPYIVDVAANYAWSTPVEQVIPLDSIRMVLLNRDTVAIDDVTASVTITDPSGNATTFTEIAGTIDPYTSFAQVSGEYLVKFSEAYTPTEVGEYTATFTASTPDGVHPINQESRTVQFRVTDDHTFAIDNGEIDVEEGLSIYPQAYIDSAGVYFVGALYRMGQNDAVATHATFGISNPQELAPGFKIFANIYDADFDLNGQVDDITPLISDPEGSATYTLTGDEIPNQLITVEFDQPVQLGAGGIYVLFFENEGTGSHGPALSATGGPDFPGYSAVLQLGSQYELDGWEFWNDDTPGLPHGGRRPVARLHLDGFVGTQDLPPLDPSKIAVQPVPATDFITLTLDLDKVANEVNVGMLDFSGRIVRTEKLENVQHGNFSFDVSQLSAGTYFLSVITPEGFRSKKFQVVR